MSLHPPINVTVLDHPTLLFHRYKMVRAIKWVDEVSSRTLFPPNFCSSHSHPLTLTPSHSHPLTLSSPHTHFLALAFSSHPLLAISILHCPSPNTPSPSHSPPLTHSIPYSHRHTLLGPHTSTPSYLHPLTLYIPHHHPFTQVVEDAPYVTTLETLDEYNCDFCAHGGELGFSPPTYNWWGTRRKSGD